MTTATRTLEQDAVELAERGYHVFPCRPRTKLPATPNGFKDATRDERQILQWWDRTPDANIGIACGASGICVLDIDSKSGAHPTSVLKQRELHGAPMVLTGKAPDRDEQRYPNSLAGVRGAQVYFRGNLPTGPLPIDGCEIRGAGAYIIAPPSLHPSGVKYTGQLPPAAQLPDAPAWLVALAQQRNGNGKPAGPVEDIFPAGQRNQRLTSMAGSMRRRGLEADEMAAALHVANKKRCRPPLPDDEVDKIAASVARYPPADAQAAHVPEVAPDWQGTADELTELLKLDTVGLKVKGARIYGRGSNASADLRLSDGTTIMFESLRDVGTAPRLNLEVTACTGAAPALKTAGASKALALLRIVAEHVNAPSMDDLTLDWCRGYLRSASTLDLNMNDQAERWAAFCHLRDADHDTTSGTVLRHHDGTRYARTGWFRNYVKAIHDHTVSPTQIVARVARVGWQRTGARGAIKATQPAGSGFETWTFYTVPADWEEANS